MCQNSEIPTDGATSDQLIFVPLALDMYNKMALLRILEWIFFFYFLSHIPITVMVDAQAVVPQWIYPKVLVDTLHWYCRQFKDPMMMDPPAWFKSFCLCEILVQFPFFFFGTYAFWKGRCKWIRIPAIVYSSHVATTVIAIIYHVITHNFTDKRFPSPENMADRLFLCSIYAPYLLIPLLILATMLWHPAYQSTSSKPMQPAKQKPKHH